MPPQNEATTRKELIDPALTRAGWDITNPQQVRFEIPVDGTSAEVWESVQAELRRLKEQGVPYTTETLPSGICDYALYGANGTIVAIVEAKRTSRDVRLAEAQADFYVKEIEKQQGYKPIAFLSNGNNHYVIEPGSARREVAGIFSPAEIETRHWLRENRQELATLPINAAKGSVILPVFARDTYDSAVVLGLMFGLSGGGAVVGALLYSAVGHRLSRRWLYVACFVVVSLQSLVLATLPPLPVLLIVQALTGIAAGPLNPILSTVQFERVPAIMRGRVFGVVTAGAFMGMPLGVLLAGYMLEVTGVQWALVITGGCYLATTLLQVLNPVLGQMERGMQAEKASQLSASTDTL